MRHLAVFITLVVSLHAVLGRLVYMNQRSSANKLIPDLMKDIQRAIGREPHPDRRTALQQHVNALQHLQVNMFDPTSCMEKQNYKYIQSHFKAATKVLRRNGDIDATMRSAWDNYFLNRQTCAANGPQSTSCCAGTGGCGPCCYYPSYPYYPYNHCCFINVGDGSECGACCDGIGNCFEGIGSCIGGACVATGEAAANVCSATGECAGNVCGATAYCVGGACEAVGSCLTCGGCDGGACEAVGSCLGAGCGLVGEFLGGACGALGACAGAFGSCNC